MNDLKLYYSLEEAWGTSTRNNNRFLEKINSIAWDSHFFADEEHYFTLGDFALMTPVLDPFDEHKWSPSVITSDRTLFWFDHRIAPSRLQ